MLRSKMATLLTIVSAMLISAGMTWQQRLLFVGGIGFGVVVEAPRVSPMISRNASRNGGVSGSSPSGPRQRNSTTTR
jgi:hypothetical protein